MYCKLCTKYPSDTTTLLDLFSAEGRELRILDILQKHVSIVEIDHNIQHSYTICRDCCRILCDFHELYLIVESAQKEADLRDSDPIDSDTPLAKLLSDDFKLEYDTVKVEPNEIDCTSIDRSHSTVKSGKSRRRRLIAQNIEVVPILKNQPEIPLQLESEHVVKDEITTAIEDCSLDVSSDYNFELQSISDKEEYKNTNVLLESTCSMVLTKQNSKSKRLLGNKNDCKNSSKIDQALKSQVTKDNDEFLAKNFILSCCICHITLEDFSTLKKHFRSKHNIRGYVKCCGRKLLKRGVLVDHVQTHLNPDYFKCSLCKKVASDRRCLELHMKMHEKKPERTFKCETCSKSYFRRSVFMRHLQLHIPEAEKKAKCPQCEKTFPTTYIMNQHLRNTHLNAYSKICDICGKSIRGREAFRLHQQEHKGVPKPLVECELCGLKLTNKYGLSRHMKTVHSEKNAMPQLCTICSKISPTVTAHQRHMNYVHNMERKHVCPMCDKAFKRAMGLKEHMTTHTGAVLYTCPHCPKTFNSNANMHSHRKKVHRKEWEEKRLQRRCTTHTNVISKSYPQEDNSMDNESLKQNFT